MGSEGASAKGADSRSAGTVAETGLEEVETRVLDFERAWAPRGGAKEAAIRAEFRVSPTRYYQMLYALIDSPAALRFDPLLVRRLQRLREARTLARATRTFRHDTAIDQDPTQ